VLSRPTLARPALAARSARSRLSRRGIWKRIASIPPAPHFGGAVARGTRSVLAAASTAAAGLPASGYFGASLPTIHRSLTGKKITFGRPPIRRRPNRLDSSGERQGEPSSFCLSAGDREAILLQVAANAPAADPNKPVRTASIVTNNMVGGRSDQHDSGQPQPGQEVALDVSGTAAAPDPVHDR